MSKKRGNMTAIIIAVIALGVSIGSLIYSSKANQISEEANRISEKALSQAMKAYTDELRPRLQLKPTKYDGITLRAKQLENKIIFYVDITMKNVGKFTATNITSVESWKFVVDNIELTPDKIPPFPDTLSLSHTQDVHINRYFTYTNKNTETIKKIMALWNKETAFVTGDITVNYSDDSSEHDYSVSASYKLTRLQDILLKSSDK